MKTLVRLLIVTAAAALALFGLAYLYFNVVITAGTETCQQIAQWAAADAARPMAFAWRDQNFYVVDAEHGVVHQYRDRARVAEWTGFERPVAIAVSETAVYVADFLADQVVTLDRDGTVLMRWGRHGIGPGEFDAPAGIAVDSRGNVYVSDFYNHRIQRFDGEGRFLDEWGERGTHCRSISMADRHCGEQPGRSAGGRRVQQSRPGLYA